MQTEGVALSGMARHRYMSMLGAVMVAGTIVMTSCASSGTKANGTRTGNAGGTSAAKTRRAATPAIGDVRILAYSINSDGPRFRAILTGVTTVRR